MKKIYISGIILTSIILMSGCAKFLDKQPLANVTSVGFYNTKDNTTLAVNAIYDVWTWERWGHLIWAQGDCASDDAEAGGDPTILTDQVDLQNIMLYKTLPNNTYVTNFSKMCYTGIQRANNVLKGTDASNINMNYDPSELRGEATFMRAMLYYYLVTTMGPVPLILDPVTNDQFTTGNRDGSDDNGTKQIEKIYNQIVTDLTYAASVLPAFGSTALGRATKAGAYGYLIKTYAIMASSKYIFPDKKDYWNQILTLSDKIRKEDPRTLEPDYHRLFTVEGENVSESLYEIQFLPGSGAYGPQGEGSITSIDEAPRGLFNSPGGGNYGYGLNSPTIDLVKQFDLNTGTGAPTNWKDEWVLVPNPDPTQNSGPKKEAYLKGLITSNGIDLMNKFVDYDPRIDLIAKPGDSLYNINSAGVGTYYQIRAFKGNADAYYSVTGFWGAKTCSALKSGSDQVNQLNKKLLRYADVLLLEAEASFHTGDISRATNLVNQIRTRAQNSRLLKDSTSKGGAVGYLKGYKLGKSTTPALFTTDVSLADIQKERRLELFLEGVRFCDLVRWDLANTICSKRPTEFHGRSYSWRNDQTIYEPIPSVMISDGKGNVVQNAGY